MAETFSKKEKREKRAKKKMAKMQKMEERKLNNDKGKELEEMLVYGDENGNLTTVRPTVARERREIKMEDIQLGAAPVEPKELVKTGVVSFFSDKGYGFIMEDKTREKFFVHRSELAQPVSEGDRVTFETAKTERGYNAIRVQLATK